MSSYLSSKITDGIRVDVRTAYVEDESSPLHNYYVFLYQIEIVNESDHEVQLLRREWTIIDGLAQTRKVEGEGVVGKQPILTPGQSHSYKSGCHFPSPIGKMKGRYLMERRILQERFWVEIPPFTLQVPCLSN